MPRYARLLPFVLVIASACSKDNPVGPPVIATVTVTPGTDTLIAFGRTRQFSAVPKDANGNPVSGVTLVWHSSNPAVATVDSATGIVTAVANGLSVIRADAGGVIGQATLAVAQVVATVVVSPPSAGFTAVGDTQRLAGVAKDSGGAIVQGVRFVWQSSDQAVATVDTGGLLRSKGPGQTFITAAGRGVPGFAVVTVTQTAARLVFVGAPANVVAGDVFPTAVQVEVRDSNDALITSARNAITIVADSGPAGALAGVQTVGAVGGVATFSAVVFNGLSGSHTLKATANGIASGASPHIAVAPALASAIGWVTSGGPTGAVGDTQPAWTLELRDRFGNLATTTVDSVHLVVASSHWGSHVVGPSAVVPVSGIATFAGFTVDRPGTDVRLAGRIGSASSPPSPNTLTDTLPTVTTAAIGATHLCAIAAGRAFCWGRNSFGELGNGTTANDSVPVLVQSPDTFASVTAGDYNSCAVTVNGAAICWGLAYGHLDGDSLPVPVPGGLTFSKLSAGSIHTCGLTPGGAVYCWGDNEYGQLGDGMASGLSSFTPVLAAGGHTFTDLSVNGFATCAVATGGDAYCWGFGSYGQLGTGATTSDSVPTLVQGGHQFTQISLAYDHACGIAIDSLAYCWGQNGSGQLGDGTASPDSAPVALDSVYRFIAIATGGGSTCARDGASHLWCWGTFGAGASSLPFELPAVTVSALFNGMNNVCALFFGTSFQCWGTNDEFEIGDGTRDYRSSPHPPVTFAPRRSP